MSLEYIEIKETSFEISCKLSFRD